MLDADLLSFIKGSIRSTWALELLLLLRKRAPQAIAREVLVLELRGSRTLIDGCARQLAQAGLVTIDENGAVRYAPASPLLDDICAKLESAYAERPVTIINAIVASPNDRLQSFADAFRFTKKDD